MGKKNQFSHGAGSIQMHQLINNLNVKTLDSLQRGLRDSEIINCDRDFNLAFTTDSYLEVHYIHDCTRGGLAATLNEIVQNSEFGGTRIIDMPSGKQLPRIS